MSTQTIVTAVFRPVMTVGAILAEVLSGRRGPGSISRPRPEDVGQRDSRGINQRTPIEPEDARMDVDSPDELATVEGDQYLTDWTALQAKFIG